MTVRAPENVACRQYGDWLKVDWSYLHEPGDTLAGFKVKWGDGGVPVTWDVPPAVDTELQGGDGGNPREYFSVLLRISDGLICDWESFETYPLGVVTLMDDNFGGKWDGAWGTQETELGYKGYGDSFESYSVGVQVGVLNGGKGWIGPWYNGA